MGKVIAAASMSLDGYIAKADNTIGHLFDWYQSGGVEVPTATPDLTVHLTPEKPVVMGEGRPFFGQFSPGDVPLGNPTICVPSDRVIHLMFAVKR